MSYRKLQTDEALAETLKRTEERLTRLERGGAIAGRISLHNTITVGGVEVIVTDGPDDTKVLTFRNPKTGAEHVINIDVP